MFKYVTTFFKDQECSTCPFSTHHPSVTAPVQAICLFYNKPILLNEKGKTFAGKADYCKVTNITVCEEK